MRASAADVEGFRSALCRAAGWRFGDDKLPQLEEVLRSRLAAASAPTVAAYLDGVVSTPHELAEVARALTVSETYFFRDRGQFQALDALLRARAATSARRLRLLSAGCSTGDEAYSLAIAVREAIADLDAWSVSILGVDLNPAVLDKARKGVFTSWSLRDTTETFRHRYFRDQGGAHGLVDGVREMVTFEHHNLVRPGPGLWRADAFDIVFCRNMLMYLAPAAARDVVAGIARSLVPGGHLFVGHAENLRGLSHDFHLRHTHGTFYYERHASLQGGAVELGPPRPSTEQGPPGLAADTTWFEAIARASRRIETLSRGSADPTPWTRPTPPMPAGRRASTQPDLTPAMDLMKQERFHEALGLLLGAESAGEPDALLLRAMLLVSTGDAAGAERQCRQLLALDELNAGAHYIMAICREHAGDAPAAVEHSHAATYLDAQFAMPHLQLGRLARRAGDRVTAERELALALTLLDGEDAARIILFGGGFSRDGLLELCRGELAACGASP